MAKSKQQPIKRLSPAQLSEVNELLDKNSDGDHIDERRSYRRFNFRTPKVVVNISHPGGGTSTVVAGTRNLSSGGLAFIYWGFLHNGTGCEISMKTQAGQTHTVSGKVVSCRHVSGTYHLIGIQFGELIDPWLFFRQNQSTNIKYFDPNAVKARVLYIAGTQADHEAAHVTFDNTQFDLTIAADMEEVVEMLKGVRFDIMLCDIDLYMPSGSALITALHALAPNQPIVILTSSEEEIKSTSSKPAHTVIHKPYDQQQLLDILYLCLSAGKASEHLDAIPSQLGNNAEMVEKIQSFLMQVEHQIEQMRQAAIAEDIGTVNLLCQTLQAQGKQYGYPMLSAGAIEVIKLLEETQSINQTSNEISHLINLCESLVVA